MSTTTRHLLATAAPHPELRLALSWDSTDPFAVVMDMYPPGGRVVEPPPIPDCPDDIDWEMAS